MAKHRPAAEGGYQRGEETRARIVKAALKLFSEHGFEGASTRDIASAANVNAPALRYYFDSKEGVYLACIGHIITLVWEQLEEPVAAAEATLGAHHVEDSALIKAYLNIQSGIISFINESPETSDWRLFMAREQLGLGPAAASSLMDENVNRRMFAVTSAIVGRLIGRPANDEITAIRAFALNSQGYVFQLMRRHAMDAFGWNSIEPKQVNLIQTTILEQVSQTLHQMVTLRDSKETPGTPS